MGGIYAKLFGKKSTFHTVLVGLSGSGKTTILHRIGLPQESKQALRAVTTHVYKNILVASWDLNSSQRKPDSHMQFLQCCDAVIFVLDSSNVNSYGRAKEELLRLLSNTVELKESILLVLANKQDLDNSCSPNTVIEELALDKLEPKRIWKVFPTVALSGEGLQEAFKWLSEVGASRGGGLCAELPSAVPFKY